MDKLLRILAVGAAAAWLVAYGGDKVAAQSNNDAETEQTAQADQAAQAEPATEAGEAAEPEDASEPVQVAPGDRIGGTVAPPLRRQLERRAYDTQRGVF
jgi:pyruvate/2-oxoglutarate dehydrogenase complex dihydrolipoamide acyltransferase (E2) component